MLNLKTLNFKTIAFTLFSLSVIGYFHKSYKTTRGFALDFLETPLVENNLLYDLSPQTLDILSQKFTYLASGRQAYVFESEDKKYVLKILSSKRFIGKKNQKLLDQELESYRLSHRFLKKESGLCGIKLGTSSDLFSITIVDPWHRKRTLDLNKACFIVQHKATALVDVFKNKPDTTEQTLLEVSALLKSRQDKNILDKDPRIHRNMGLGLEGPLFLDLGAFYEDATCDESKKQEELKKIFDYNTKFLQSLEK